ncbi:MAG: hypothetical protein H6810_03490 [Phycisphaeraceae bacterium]|nr:MAG: hypothetical protein H6810_03490 [Phycisphaeraceae bacterium]
MSTSNARSPWVWVGTAIACFLGVVLGFGGVFAYAFINVANGGNTLQIDGETRLTKSDLADNVTIYLRERSNFTPADAFAAITAHDGEGNPIPLAADMSSTLEIPSGNYRSVATVDLSSFPDNAEICFETAGLSGKLQSGDLTVMPGVLWKLLIAIFSSCALNAILVPLGIVSIIMAVKRFSAR